MVGSGGNLDLEAGTACTGRTLAPSDMIVESLAGRPLALGGLTSRLPLKLLTGTISATGGLRNAGTLPLNVTPINAPPSTLGFWDLKHRDDNVPVKKKAMTPEFYGTSPSGNATLHN